MNEYIASNIEVWQARRPSGFISFEKNGVFYNFWNQKDASACFNLVFTPLLTVEIAKEIKSNSQDYQVGIFTLTEQLNDQLSKLVKLEECLNIFDANIKKPLAYKSDILIKKVQNLAELEQWAQFAGRLFETDPSFIIKSFQGDLNTGVGSYYFALKDNKIVAVTQAIKSSTSAGIYWVAVDENQRLKNYGHDIVVFAINDIQEQGINQFTLCASEIGEYLYKKLGFTKSPDKIYEYVFI